MNYQILNSNSRPADINDRAVRAASLTGSKHSKYAAPLLQKSLAIFRSCAWILLVSSGWLSAAGQCLAEEAIPLVQKLGKARVELRLDPQPHFALSGLSLQAADIPLAQAAEFFTVAVAGSQLKDPPPLSGEYSLSAEQMLLFTPRYPLSPVVSYRLRLGERALNAAGVAEGTKSVQSLVFRLPAEPPRPPTEVAAVYPSDNKLPENLLKFYIHFSAPMSRGQAYERIHLYEDDQLVAEPFLELGEELWDVEQTRFTLLLHPGRIKRGLKPREEQGPAMASGHTYSLRIDRAWIDAHRQPLAEEFVKTFTVTTADHGQLNPEKWKIETPRSGTRNPVTLIFDEPLDHAMLSRVLHVEHNSGRAIDGVGQPTASEMKWEFAPQEAWAIGTYRIQVATNLEDLCGNSIARPFEVKMQQRVASQPSTHIAIEFIVK